MWWQIALASVGLILLADSGLLGLLYFMHWAPSQNGSYPLDVDAGSHIALTQHPMVQQR